MGARVRTLYWVVAVIFLLVTLAETGFFIDTEGMVVGKKTSRIWGLPMSRRLVIKYQEPGEPEAGRLVIRYNHVPVTHGVYEKFKKGDKLEHNKFSFVFFCNDESISFSWDARSTVSIFILAFLFIAAIQYGRPQSTRHEEDTPILFFPLNPFNNGGIPGDEEEVTENKTGVVIS